MKTGKEKFNVLIAGLLNSNDSILMAEAKNAQKEANESGIDEFNEDEYYSMWNDSLQQLVDAWTLANKVFENNKDKQVPLYVTNKYSGVTCKLTKKQSLLYHYIMAMYQVYKEAEEMLVSVMTEDLPQEAVAEAADNCNMAAMAFNNAKLYFRVNWGDEYYKLID